jgi:hypothetical protein
MCKINESNLCIKKALNSRFYLKSIFNLYLRNVNAMKYDFASKFDDFVAESGEDCTTAQYEMLVELLKPIVPDNFSFAKMLVNPVKPVETYKPKGFYPIQSAPIGKADSSLASTENITKSDSSSNSTGSQVIKDVPLKRTATVENIEPQLPINPFKKLELSRETDEVNRPSPSESSGGERWNVETTQHLDITESVGETIKHRIEQNLTENKKSWIS